MNQNLGTYLHDYLAGAGMAIDLIQSLNHKHLQETDKIFLDRLFSEVTEDRDTLQRFANEAGYGVSSVKNSGAALAAKLVSLKLRAGEDAFGRFESLEFLALGILGKRHLWKALQQNLPSADGVATLDFDRLIQRADAQYAEVERHRLACASEAIA
jgi:hypothetical protein